MLEIGKKIKMLRQTMGWSQGEVAAKINLSIAAFSKIEKGVTDVSISRLQQLADLFQVSLAELIVDQSALPPAQHYHNTDREIINTQLAKIVELQEYIISLYEQLQALKPAAGVHPLKEK